MRLAEITNKVVGDMEARLERTKELMAVVNEIHGNQEFEVDDLVQQGIKILKEMCNEEVVHYGYNNEYLIVLALSEMASGYVMIDGGDIK